jgi:beta-lactamase regulating signal transducer with metallopeptidase domain
MNAVMSGVSAWLLDFGMLASLLLAAALTGRWLCRQAGQRMALAWATWLGVLLLAILTALPQWPRHELAGLLAARRGEDRAETTLPLPLGEGRGEGLSLPVGATNLHPHPNHLPEGEGMAVSRLHDLLQWPTIHVKWNTSLALAWLAIAALATSWILLGLVQTCRLVTRSSAAPGWVVSALERIVGQRRRKPQVRTTPTLSAAAAIGALHPRILLPQAGIDEKHAAAVRAALAHEWAHIRHGDLWLLALERLLLPLLAWQPLFWWLRRSVRLDQELLADAAAAGDEPVEYAEALLAWAKTARPPPVGLAALSLWESPHTLSRRVAMLVDPNRPALTPLSRRWQAVFVVFAAALVCGLSLLTLRPLTADETPPATAAAPLADNPPPVPAPKVGILLQSIVLEAEPKDVEVLVGDGGRAHAVFPHPVTDVEVRLRTPDAVRLSLDTVPKVRVLSRPQVLTLDGTTATVQIDPQALHIELTPRLVVQQSQEQVVQLGIQLDHTQHVPGTDILPLRRTRRLSLSVEVPLGKTVVITAQQPGQTRAANATDPNVDAKPAETVLVLAIEPQVVPLLGAGPLSAADKPAATSPAAREVHQRLNELRQQIDRLAAQPEAQRDAAALRHAMQRLQREIDQLIGQLPPTGSIVVPPPPARASADQSRPGPVFHRVNGDAVTLARQLGEALKQQRIESVTIAADPKSNSLIVVSSAQHAKAVEGLINALDQPKSPDAATDQAIRRESSLRPSVGLGGLAASAREAAPIPPSPDAAMPPAIQRGMDDLKQRPAASVDALTASAREAASLGVGRETQIKLLKLDIQDAELGRQVAESELEYMLEVLKKNPGAVSETEVRKYKFQLSRAEIQLQKLKVLLEGLEQQESQPRVAR